MIKTIADITSSVNNGKIHIQRFYKTAGQAGDTYWQDWSYASGQPSYDARVGTALEFNPYTAVRNDAIYFPSKNSDETRHLLEMTIRTLASGTNQVVCDILLYDLLGVYPLIDGDSTDEQVFDNTETLPRYEDGIGVIPVIVNHVAPTTSTGSGTIKYIGTDDVEYSASLSILNSGINKICGANGTTSIGNVGIGFYSGAKGAKSVSSITFSTPPGGLFAVYMIKMLGTIANHDGAAVAEKIFTEKNFMVQNAAMMPEIKDGAWLGMFYRPNGSERTVSLFGTMTFVWG